MYIWSNHTNWDHVFPFVTFGYNTVIQRTAGYSPFFLVFGRCPSFVMDTTLLFAPVSPARPFADQFIFRVSRRQLRRINTEAAQQQRENEYDATHRAVHFRPWDE